MDDSGAKDAAKTLTEVAEKSVTVLKGECSFAGTDAISIVGGSEKEQTELSEAAKAEGLHRRLRWTLGEPEPEHLRRGGCGHSRPVDDAQHPSEDRGDRL